MPKCPACQTCRFDQTAPLTVLVGANGSGKSTLAAAEAAGAPVYRLDPYRAQRSVKLPSEPAPLLPDGRNLAAVLWWATTVGRAHHVQEWLRLAVPAVRGLRFRHGRGRVRCVLVQEDGTPLRPAPLGVVLLLSILVAVQERGLSAPGRIVIEDPERGLHPKVLQQLVPWLRAEATPAHPIWLTTHSETLVRALQPEELWLADRRGGALHVRSARGWRGDDLAAAWLTNSLNGGLPW